MEHRVEYQVTVHNEEGSYWAEVAQLPGLFVSGDTLDEVFEALNEAILLYMNEPGKPELGMRVSRVEEIQTTMLVC